MAAAQTLQPASVPSVHNIPISGASTNVGSLAKALQGTETIPEVFLLPESERVTVPHDGYSEQVSLPVVDLGELLLPECSEESRKRIAREVAEASSEWGFFQVAGHGIPLELLERVRTQGRAFFSLPAEDKEKASLGLFQGYEGRHGFIPTRVPWSETFTLLIAPTSNVVPIVEKLWPDGNSELSSTIMDYGNELHCLGVKILELLAESLDLDQDFFSKNFKSKHSAGMRMNFYPPCPQPSMALGLGAHADPNCLTMLYQDEVGGLQIQKDDKWIAVKPDVDSLVLNIGDSLQAWSNGRFRSVQHRAVVNGNNARLSVAFFYSPDDSVSMEVPAQLVDEAHPLLYRPFTWAEYLQQIRTKRMRGKGGLDTFMKISDESKTD
ncbi:2-oxoacid dioxygenase [Selaginella moellendorffii]|uniref:2-oxoacid dioxygenase n=1 Tax=Selaginella moellendorffii TaxID=88036 RepID=D8SB22_SELML|nr:probable 2-oxoglutarate-dependent dioxygenase ANS [Selaginella moellendorffii]EFJ18175.1 2-oxoacid dioxygenase [Selaginella moellendorffii]|eukprot:XP_002980524.1 probable 2-oxoglutarate-dependent dioxygenase ANS [Selaginella moellendorffii]